MNKPSLLSSFLIFVVTVFLILMIGWGVLKLVEKVSEDKNDFDYTFIHLKYDNDREMLIKREFQLDGLFVRANVYFDEQACITSP